MKEYNDSVAKIIMNAYISKVMQNGFVPQYRIFLSIKNNIPIDNEAREESQFYALYINKAHLHTKGPIHD